MRHTLFNPYGGSPSRSLHILIRIPHLFTASHASNYVCQNVLHPSHTNSISCLAFSPDGAYLASGGDDGGIFIFSGKDWECLCGVSYHLPLQALLWHPSRNCVLISGYADGRVIWSHFDPARGDPEICRKIFAFDTPVHALAFDPKHNRLAVGSGSCVKIYERKQVNGPYKHATVYNHGGDMRIVSLAFAEEGSRLIGSFLENLIICWDPASMSAIWSKVSATKIGSSDVSPDASQMVACNLRDGFEVYPLAPTLPVASASFKAAASPDRPFPVLFVHSGEAILGGSASGRFQLWDLQSSTPLQTLPHENGGTTQAIAACSDGDSKIRRIATAISDQEQSTIKIWQAHVSGPYTKSPAKPPALRSSTSRALRMKELEEHWQATLQSVRESRARAKAFDLLVASVFLFGLWNPLFSGLWFRHQHPPPSIIAYTGAPGQAHFNPPWVFECTTTECATYRTGANQPDSLPPFQPYERPQSSPTQDMGTNISRTPRVFRERVKHATRSTLFYFYAALTGLSSVFCRFRELVDALIFRVHAVEKEIRAWVYAID
ncbi:hypothetical protein BOTBODRAFT_181678 [Botryobasidium botryosum FD-172 SS1]|uniref:Uncharacterized protein n=1 Tax=Botryobasidium botryosum (strain FD-172 SS1) TaxID=930990 RepID=A0A067M3D8_BOTB1|nr:hypothetical protein BOTBODRAFT_181678 [Botryobasidium botryosum FD-172 SS1]